MALLGILCRWLRCPTPEARKREGTAEKAEASPADEMSSDDLTVIGGISIATQNRLYGAGIKSYARLAQASPEEVREILGRLARGADLEDWIAQAKKLAKQRKS